MRDILKQLQIDTGKAAAIVDSGSGSALWAAMSVVRSALEVGEVGHVLFGASAKATEQAYQRLGQTNGLSVIARTPGSLADAQALAQLAAGRVLVVLEGFRAGVGSGDAWGVLAALEHVSAETGCAFLCVLSAPAPELLDGFGCVLEVRAQESASSDVKAYPVQQVQRPRGALDGAKTLYLVIEQQAGALQCSLQADASSAADREQLRADADALLVSLLDQPGRVVPQLDGVTYDRCARAIERLEAAGSVSTQPASFGALRYFPSESEIQRRAALDCKVFETIEAYPDILLSSIAARAQLAPSAVGPALRRLGDRICAEANAGEPSYTTRALAIVRGQQESVLAILQQRRRVSVESVCQQVGCAEEIAQPVFERQVKLGDLAALDGGLYEYTTPPERAVRKAVMSAKKALAVHEIAEASGQPEGLCGQVVKGLVESGALVWEMKSGAYYYSRPAKSAA